MTAASGENKQGEGTLGLKRHTVRVVAPRAEWQELYKRHRRALLERVGHLVVGVQHVGSTAVPGLDAKPILDIAVAVSSTEVISQLERPLDELGYIYRGDAGADGGRLFVKESAPDVRTHHLHVVAADDPQWREWLLFRDKLRTDEALRARYAALKNDLQERFAEDRRGTPKRRTSSSAGLCIRGPNREISRRPTAPNFAEAPSTHSGE